MNNNFNRSTPIKNTSGGGHSAARYTGTHGHKERSHYWVFIPGEGWVTWLEIHKQFSAAFNDWQMRHILGLRKAKTTTQ
jgi:hypothetical protein